MPEKHTYVRTHKISGETVSANLTKEAAALSAKATTAAAGRAAKTLAKGGALRVTLVALKKGTTLQKHAVEGATTIQLVRGRVRINIDRDSHLLTPGSLLALEPGLEHDASALADSVMLLTLAVA